MARLIRRSVLHHSRSRQFSARERKLMSKGRIVQRGTALLFLSVAAYIQIGLALVPQNIVAETTNIENKQQRLPINLQPKPKPKYRANLDDVWKIPQFAYDQVKQPDLELPLTISLPLTPQHAKINDDTPPPQRFPRQLTLRLLQASDIPQVSDLCSQEYGRKRGLPCWSQLSLPVVLGYLDDLSLRPLVETTLRMKVHYDDIDGTSYPEDHAVLVLEATRDSHDDSTMPVSEIIGMVEVSRQPVIPERNPPATPMPLWIKRLVSHVRAAMQSGSAGAYSANHQQQQQSLDYKYYREPQGWITNLLVAPAYRQHGCAKLLVGACEGITAHWWGCSSIHLHCDAHPQRGKPSQRLYMEGLNYQTLQERQQGKGVTAKTQQSTTTADKDSTKAMLTHARVSSRGSAETSFNQAIGPMPFNSTSSIFIIQGVPLLYLQKQL